jgi:hypothetical protein
LQSGNTGDGRSQRRHVDRPGRISLYDVPSKTQDAPINNAKLAATSVYGDHQA